MAGESTFRLYLQGGDAAPTPYNDGVTATRSIERVLQPGDGAGQNQTVTALDLTLALSGTQTLDLKTLLDAFGVALALDEMIVLFVENVNDGLGGVLELRPSGANGFTNLLGAGSAIKLPKGCAVTFHLGDFDAINKWLVTAGNKSLDIVETGGAFSAHLRVQLWGRK